MARFRVWHKKNSDFWTCATELNAKDFEMVAFVEADNHDEVFRLTNSIDDHWWNNEGVDMSTNLTGCRSTSVGDIVQNMTNGQIMAVDKVGWKEIPWNLN